MGNVQILFMNCRGLADLQKINFVLNSLRDKG